MFIINNDFSLSAVIRCLTFANQKLADSLTWCQEVVRKRGLIGWLLGGASVGVCRVGVNLLLDFFIAVTCPRKVCVCVCERHKRI